MKRILLPLLTAVLGVSASHAAFDLIDDFNSYTAGTDLTAATVWEGNSGFIDILNIGTGNNAARFITDPGSSGFVNSTTALSTPANGTTTLFFQMQIQNYVNLDGEQSANNVALRNASSSNGYSGVTRNQMSLEQTNPAETSTAPLLQYRDGNTAVYPGTPVIAVDTWYNFWIVSTEGATDSWALYSSTGTNPASLVESGISWRTASFETSVKIMLGNPNINTVSAGALVDNFYFDATGANLTNPVPEPSTYALLFGLATLGFVAVRRRLAR